MVGRSHELRNSLRKLCALQVHLGEQLSRLRELHLLLVYR